MGVSTSLTCETLITEWWRQEGVSLTQWWFIVRAGRVPGSPGATVVAVAIACVVALMLPTEGDRRSQLPQYLHLSVTQKMIAAYILGGNIFICSFSALF